MRAARIGRHLSEGLEGGSVRVHLASGSGSLIWERRKMALPRKGEQVLEGWHWSSGEVSGGKVGKRRGRWGKEVGKCGSCQCVFGEQGPVPFSVSVPVSACVSEGLSPLDPSLSIHMWSLAFSPFSTLRPGCPGAGLSLAPILGGIWVLFGQAGAWYI